MLDEPRLLAAHPWVTRRPITVTEYHRMGEVGILGDRDRVELIEGELVAMSPIGSYHHGTVNKLTHALVQAVGERAVVSVQGPVRLDEFSEPEPDFALLKPRPDFYQDAHAGPADVLMLIEVADTSLNYDRAVSARSTHVTPFRNSGSSIWLGRSKCAVDPRPTATRRRYVSAVTASWSRNYCLGFAFKPRRCFP